MTEFESQVEEILRSTVVDAEAVRACLRNAIETGLSNESSRDEIAYVMSGLLAIDLAALPDSVTIRTALEIFSELEIPSRHRSAGASWRRLGTLLSQLE